MRPNEFFKKHGQYNRTDLGSSRVQDSGNVKMPMESLVHAYSDSDDMLGIRGSHPLVQAMSLQKKVRVFHVESGYGERGKPKPSKASLSRLQKDYFRKQRAWALRSRNLDTSIRAKRVDVVMDYSMLEHGYRYTQSEWISYYRYDNMLTAFVDNIVKYDGKRVQFVPIQLPGTVPDKTAFKRLGDGVSALQLGEWGESGALWLWLLWEIIHERTDLAKLTKPEMTYFYLMEGKAGCFVSVADLLGVDKSKTVNERRNGYYRLLVKLKELNSASDVGGDAAESEGDVGKAEADKKANVEPAVPETVVEQMRELTELGRMSAAEVAALTRLSGNVDKITHPVTGQPLGEMTKAQDNPPVRKGVTLPIDKSPMPEHAKSSTVSNYRADYVHGMMEQDITRALMGIKSGGYIITEFKAKEVLEATNDYMEYEVTYVAVNGKKSKVVVKVPKFDDHGRFVADGVRYTMDGQRGDLPLRKIKPHIAAITTYPGKIFIQRSEKKKFSYSDWLLKSISSAALDSKDRRVSKVTYGANKIPKDRHLPRAYTALMENLTSFSSGELVFWFDYKNRVKQYDAKRVAKAEGKDKYVVVGHNTKSNSLLVMDMSDTIHTWDGKTYRPLGTLLGSLGGQWGSAPHDVAEMKMGRRNVPVAFPLAYLYGLEGLLKTLKAKYRWRPAGERVQVPADHLLIKFKDGQLLVNVEDPAVGMVMAGFASVPKQTINYTTAAMNRKSTYGAFVRNAGLSAGRTREWDLMNEMFIDPISAEILRGMEEPDKLKPLLIRCVELLTVDWSPDENDTDYQRVRGSERVSGAIYKVLYDAAKQHRYSPAQSTTGLWIGPEDVWQGLISDASVQLVQDSNPLHAIKDSESVTLSGEGGRSARSLTKPSRTFHPNDLGNVSEQTPDSAKVGTRYPMPPGAKLTDMRGRMGRWEKADGATSILSTTALVLPAIHHDDGKRIMMAGIQRSSWVAAVGQVTPPVRTGYEEVVASRAPQEYATNAPKAGKVVSADANYLKVEYVDGTKEGFKLGVYHGDMAGMSVPHTVMTDMVKGSTFKEGDIIAWNRDFFERSFLNGRNVTLKTGVLARIALLEHSNTHEDGSAIHERLSKALGAPVAQKRTLHVKADQNISQLIAVGTQVGYDTILGVISEQVLEGVMDDKSLNALSSVGNSVPKAKFDGVVSNIEVHYMGDPSEMSTSLQTLISYSDKKRASHRRNTGARVATTGRITRPTFIGGSKVTEGTVAITIYMDAVIDCQTADKLVVCNQLKSVPGRVMTGNDRTLDGVPLDLLFGGQSVNARIVGSIYKVGALTTALKHLGRTWGEMTF